MIYIVVGTIEKLNSFEVRTVTYRYTDNSPLNKLVPDILSDISTYCRKEGWDFKPLTVLHEGTVLWTNTATAT